MKGSQQRWPRQMQHFNYLSVKYINCTLSISICSNVSDVEYLKQFKLCDVSLVSATQNQWNYRNMSILIEMLGTDDINE